MWLRMVLVNWITQFLDFIFLESNYSYGCIICSQGRVGVWLTLIYLVLTDHVKERDLMLLGNKTYMRCN